MRIYYQNFDRPPEGGFGTLIACSLLLHLLLLSWVLLQRPEPKPPAGPMIVDLRQMDGGSLQALGAAAAMSSQAPPTPPHPVPVPTLAPTPVRAHNVPSRSNGTSYYTNANLSGGGGGAGSGSGNGYYFPPVPFPSQQRRSVAGAAYSTYTSSR